MQAKKKLKFRTEAEFQAAVVAYAQLNGWQCFHQGDSRSCAVGQGYPDLTLISQRESRIVFVELKRAKGEVSIEQVRYAALILSLDMPGVEYYLWRPKDLPEILQRLKAKPETARTDRFRQVTARMIKNFQMKDVRPYEYR